MELDLHGVKHEDVPKKVEEYIYSNQVPYSIVTGNSARMKEIVIEVLKKYDMEYIDFGPKILAK